MRDTAAKGRGLSGLAYHMVEGEMLAQSSLES
jgi:hypothetical protein